MFNTKIKVGFVISSSEEYTKTMASTRLRCFDVIIFLNNKKIKAEVYNSQKKYEIVIFQKCYSKNHIELARRLKQEGSIVVFDINIDVSQLSENMGIYSQEQIKTINEQKEDINIMLKEVDYVLTSTEYLKSIYSQYHSDVFCIEENVNEQFFKVKKEHKPSTKINLLYVGYSSKAIEINIIKDVLIQLNKEYNIELNCVTDSKPEINYMPINFYKYDQNIVHKQLLDSDIKIAPRDLTKKYNLGHSFTKVAYPMAVGIPAVASPVPSYLNREVLICNNTIQWNETLKKLITNHNYRNYIGNKSREFVLNNFTINTIGQQYIDLIKYILNANIHSL